MGVGGYIASTHPALAYWAWIKTLWKMNERHDCHARPRAANDGA